MTYEPPTRNYEVTLYGNNIGDEITVGYCTQSVGLYMYRYAEPATWGVEFRARWGG